MKRYLLFAYNTYYPSGGVNDLLGDFDHLHEARAHLDGLSPFDHVEALDITTGERTSFDASPPCAPFTTAGRRTKTLSAADVIEAMALPPGWTPTPMPMRAESRRTAVTPGVTELMAGGSIEEAVPLSPATMARIAQGLLRFTGQHVHDVRHDQAGFLAGYPRLTCYDEACGGATIVSQPYTTKKLWDAKVAVFMAAHLCLVVKSADPDGPTMTYDPETNTFTQAR